MRLLTLALALFLLLAGAYALINAFSLQHVHIASLVPGDFRFGVFYSSTNRLIELHEGPFQRKDLEPARKRIGERINVPELNGIDYELPVGYFFDANMKEIMLVPYRDFSVLRDAFDAARENLNLKPPERVGLNYVSLSTGPEKAKVAADNPLVLAAAEYPIAAVGQPRDASELRNMLIYLLAFEGGPAFEAHRGARGTPMLAKAVGRLPSAVGDFVCRCCADLLIGVASPAAPKTPARIELRVTPQGPLARPVQGVELATLVRAFPIATRIWAGGVLDEMGWREIGVPVPGDAACAFGIVDSKYRGRRYSLLLAVQPRDPAVLETLLPPFLADAAALEWKRIDDDGVTVQTALLDGAPAGLEGILRSNQSDPPPIYVTTCVADGVWFCAFGSQAEHAVRSALGCLRGAEQLSLLGRRHGEINPILAHDGFAAPGHTAAAYITAEGMRALQYPMPLVGLAFNGQPSAVTFTFDVGRQGRGDLRLFR